MINAGRASRNALSGRQWNPSLNGEVFMERKIECQEELRLIGNGHQVTLMRDD